MLLALALSPQGLYSNYAQTRFGIAKGAAPHALRSLSARGEVVTRGDTAVITDPLLRWWLRHRRYPDG